MKLLNDLFTNNREWAERIKAEDPEFFATLSAQQAPEYLWIGCSDSRVPANQLMGLLPGTCSSTATSPTWWYTPTSTASRCCNTRSRCSR